MSEKWLPVVGMEGRYDVSDLGRVRGHSRWAKGDGVISQVMRAGYPSVGLYADAKAPCRLQLVHRLVLSSFRGECPEGLEARHLNGDSTDNRLENLCWGTKAENNADKAKHGAFHAAMAKRRKLSDAQIETIRSRCMTQKELARIMGVNRTTVQRIQKGQMYPSALSHINTNEADK